MKIKDKVSNEIYEAETMKNWAGETQYLKKGTCGPIRYAKDVEILEEDKPKDNTDWASFRREAAKEILAGLVVQKNWRYHPDEYDKDEEEAQKRAAKRAAYTAIVYADELIKQLREGEK